MRAVLVRAHGGLEALSEETVAEVAPGPGEVEIEIKACGVNHLDLWVRRGVPGHKFPLPLILGSDVSGRVRSLGSGVADLALGAEVVVAPATSCGHCLACLSGHDHQCASYAILGEGRNGGYAERIVVPRSNVMEKPQALSFEQAAAVGIPFLTAWHMLVARAEVRPGETVLVQAGGSGVGVAAIQIAKMWGARVIATAGGQVKLEGVKRIGADAVIDYAREDVASSVRALTSGRGAEVVVEHVGAATWEASLKSLGRHGRLVTCGATTGAEVKLNLRHLFFKAQSVLGSTMGSKGEFARVLAHAGAGLLAPVVADVLPLGRATEAHRRLEAREVFGRLVLIP